MIDAPGSWSTGPFTLVEGYSSIDAEPAVISQTPFACIWLQHEDRTPRVRLAANPNYWDGGRGPHLREVIFRNDLTPQQALELVCTGEGEVDIVTEVSPADAWRVEHAQHARLVSISAIRAIAGVINRDAEGLPFNDARARQALNLAIDRAGLIREALFGRAQPLAGLTPPAAVTALHRLSPYAYDARQAGALWRQAGGAQNRPLRIAAPEELARVAAGVATDLHNALGVATELIIHRGAARLEAKRQLAEKRTPHQWDIYILEQGAQSADAPPLELHRAFVGARGEWRAGRILPEFEALYAQFARQTNSLLMAQAAYNMDKFVYDQALALFLCAPQALYAVNKHVTFSPYRTTFELAECEVSHAHWSRRQRAGTAAG